MTIKLFVGNLSYSTTEEQLREIFSQKGRNVRSIRVALDRETQRPRGFAFVEMGSMQDADSAIADLHNQPISGRTIFVEKAQEKGERPQHSSPNSRPNYPNSRPNYPNSRPPLQKESQPSKPWTPRPPKIGYQAPIPFEEPKTNRRLKTKPEKKNTREKKASGRPEERERGKWRWDGNNDY